MAEQCADRLRLLMMDTNLRGRPSEPDF
jgi:hypothetical protein